MVSPRANAVLLALLLDAGDDGTASDRSQLQRVLIVQCRRNGAEVESLDVGHARRPAQIRTMPAAARGEGHEIQMMRARGQIGVIRSALRPGERRIRVLMAGIV